MSHAIEGQLRKPIVNWILAQGMTPIYECWTGGCGICDIVAFKCEARIPDA